MSAKADNQETEKPAAATGAEPSSNLTAVKKPDDEFDFQTFRENAGIMFDTREFVVDGAFEAANMDKSRTYTKEQVKKAIDAFMKREVK